METPASTNGAASSTSGLAVPILSSFALDLDTLAESAHWTKERRLADYGVSTVHLKTSYLLSAHKCLLAQLLPFERLLLPGTATEDISMIL